MNPNRLLVLLRKELRSSSSNFLFIFALVMPLAMSLVVTLLFGSIFSEQIRVGVVDLGESQITTEINALSFADTTFYEDEASLRSAMDAGNVDMAVIVPVGFDAGLQAGDDVALDLLVWGQSLAQDRAVLTASLGRIVNDVAGVEIPLTINTVNLGDGQAVPIEERLLPFLMLMAVMVGGTMVPAGSLVEEKQKRTLTAITTTPAQLREVLVAKGLLGVFLAMFVTILTLILNQALGGEPLLLIITLTLGAIMAAEFGIILGIFVKDTNTLFATIKAIGILLYAPAFVAIFPDIPKVIGQIFPTYYIVEPLLIITQQGGQFSDVAVHLAIMIVINLAMLAGIAIIIREPTRREALALA